MIKPKSLKRGDTIGLIGPSSATSIENIRLSIEKIQELGFKVIVGESCYGTYGYLSGNDDLRARDVNVMFNDVNINGIWCIRGGYGTPRILDMIDYDLIRANPKVFIGYSDITSLHIAINQKSDLITFHGPMASTELAHNLDDFTQDYLIRNIMSTQALGLIQNPKDIDIKTLVPGKCEGELIGGNLSLVVSSIGTPYEIDLKGKILFLEEIDEAPYKIDRMLTQLRLSGKLNDAEGIIFGNWNNCLAEEPKKSLTLLDIFNDIIVPLNKPTVYNLMAGHCKPMITLPFGIKLILDANNKNLFIEESATTY